MASVRWGVGGVGGNLCFLLSGSRQPLFLSTNLINSKKQLPLADTVSSHTSSSLTRTRLGKMASGRG